MKYLIMVLEGYMQSWGLQGKFNYKKTMSFPTKSGALGLLGAAMGIRREEVEKIKELTSLKMSTLCLKPGTMETDYHTVGGGYPNESNYNVLTADGDVRGTIVTHRDYLFGASFVVVLSGKEELIQRGATALDNPKWSLFLGRRCCIPTRPILEKVLENKNEVKKVLKNLGANDETLMWSDVDDQAPDDTFMDVPIDWNTRQYGMRGVISNSLLDW